jgi:hypothetical protein
MCHANQIVPPLRVGDLVIGQVLLLAVSSGMTKPSNISMVYQHKVWEGIEEE